MKYHILLLLLIVPFISCISTSDGKDDVKKGSGIYFAMDLNLGMGINYNPGDDSLTLVTGTDD